MGGIPTHRRAALAALIATAAGCSSGGSHAASSTTPPTGSTTTPPPAVHHAPRGRDWLQFGVDAARTNVQPGPTGINAATLASLRPRTVDLPGTVDSSPIYLHRVRIGGRMQSAFFMTTTYGRTLAVSAAGRILWTYTPKSYASYAGSAQITTASPAADPDRRYLYAASPDGLIHKLAVSSGRELTGGRWPVRVTRLPGREKIASALSVHAGRLYVVTGGYIGDAPPYQGHLAVIDLPDGRLAAVFNMLCANVHALLSPPTCAGSDSAIWGRAGAVIDPATGDVLVATGNGPFDGAQNWGDSVLELGPEGQGPLRTYTPSDQAQLNSSDLDLGSTAPALLSEGGPLVAQGGKDGHIRLIDLGIQGVGRLGGELQTLASPGGAQMFTAMAVWHRSPTETWLFAADGSGTEALRLQGAGRAARLTPVWSIGTAGTSPVLAGGLLFVYDPGGTLDVYRPATGARIASLPAQPGHWNSPIVAGGVIALPTGDANNHATAGTLLLY